MCCITARGLIIKADLEQQDIIKRIRTVVEDKKLELKSRDKELTDSKQAIVELRNCLQHCKSMSLNPTPDTC